MVIFILYIYIFFSKILLILYLGTIFMYGQTGSGKTFTMMGGNSNNPHE